MRLFVTGATGFVGSAVVGDLLAAGHQVLGLARSDSAARALEAAGAAALRGTLADPASLRAGAAETEGVLHLALARGEVSFADAMAADARALEVLGGSLEGSGRPLVFASATSMIEPGRVVTEHDRGDTSWPTSRGRAEDAVLAHAARDVRVVAVRLATLVHGEGDGHGFLPMMVRVARDRGVSAFVGDGGHRWPGVHRTDAARLLRLALEGAPAGARLHAVAEEGVPVREIARAVGRGLGMPVVAVTPAEAAGHFAHLGGPLAALPGTDVPASGAHTRDLMAWCPAGPDVLTDLRDGPYLRS